MKNIVEKVTIIIKSLVVFFLFYNSVIFQYIPVLLFHISEDSLKGNLRMAVLLVSFADLILLFIYLMIYRKDLIMEFKTFKNKLLENINTGFVCWLVGLFIMFASNMILISVFHSEGANNEIVVRSMVDAFPLMMGLNVCLLAPIIEEIAFRKTLKDIFKNKYLFVFASFLLFGLAHVVSQATSIIDWLYIIPYGSLGGLFAYAYHKTDTLFTSVMFHMIHNTIVFCLILFI